MTSMRSACLVLLLTWSAAGCGDPVFGVSEGQLAFTNVTVIPMDTEGTLPGRTVLVRDGVIEWMGPAAAASMDPDASVIDGTGRYLMPGLADMHVHTWRPEDLTGFVAYGVTTVRNMWGTETQLGFREQISAGTLLGPTIHTAGPLMDGDPPLWQGSLVVTDPDAARQSVREQFQMGFDFIKPYNALTAAVYDAIVGEAAGLGMPVAGHVPRAVGLEAVMAGPQVSIEHLHRYSTLLQSDPPQPADLQLGESGWLTADPALMPQLAQRLAAEGVWSVPTMALWNRMAMTPAERTAFLSLPEVAFVPAELRQAWQDLSVSEQVADLIRMGQPARRQMIGALRNAGAPILLGTDFGNPFIIAGRSVHDELATLVEAGLSPFEALRAGTTEAARFLDQVGTFGVVATGARADLILVEGNPLVDVAHAARRVGVMVRGTWFTEGQLQDRLAESLASAAPFTGFVH